MLVRPKKPTSTPDLSLLQIIAWVVVAVVLAVLVWLIVTAIMNYAGFKQPEVVGPRIATHVDHVEALPFLRQRSLDDLLGQARAHYLAGDYNEAIVYLFSYELVELDRHNLIRLAVGRTNRQYLRDLKGRAPLVGLVEGTMIAFEDVYFGGRQLSRERFESVWNHVAEFDALVAALAAQMAARDPAAVEVPVVAAPIASGTI